VVASKDGFHDGEHGRTTIRTPTGEPIELRPRQQLLAVDVALERGSTIAGTIVDTYGEPLEGITVQAWERRVVDGRPVVSRITAARYRRTDDVGRYRIHGLLPGTYYVVAIDDRAPAAGTPEVRQAPPAARTPLMADLERAREMGNRPPVFYPGRSSGADAWPVSVGRGAEVVGVDMAFANTQGVRLHGVLFDAAGRTSDASTLELRPRVPPGVPALDSRPALRGPDGAFEFLNVQPGEYVIQARRSDVVGSMRREFAAQPLMVGRSDVGPLMLRLSPGSSVTGRVVLEGEPGSVVRTAFDVRALPDDAEMASSDNPVRILDDWTFEVGGLQGLARFGLRHGPPGWWLKSVMLDGVDAAAHAVSFGRQEDSRRDVQLVLARTAPRITGRAIDTRGSGVAGAAIVVFPADAARWRGWPYHLTFVRTGTDGEFVVDTLPPGEYWVAAALGLEDRLESGDWQTPESLARLLPGGRRVRLEERQRLSIDLRVMDVQQ
jgi:protocatechuate 3,4-dioxygenase beta subunit